MLVVAMEMIFLTGVNAAFANEKKCKILDVYRV